MSLVLVMLTLMLCGCMTLSMKMDRNNLNLSSLEMGMTREEVVTIMGRPDLSEAYQSLAGKPVIVFYYYTLRKREDGRMTREECTPVIFDDDGVVGWGDEYYRRKVEMDFSARR
jgi:outer membrane protein assembly factor BamE (lipoprotein component of BamABCDE complex)